MFAPELALASVEDVQSAHEEIERRGGGGAGRRQHEEQDHGFDVDDVEGRRGEHGAVDVLRPERIPSGVGRDERATQV